MGGGVIVWSLRNKIDLLRGKVCVENFDIIAVTETWIDTNSKNFLSEFKIEGEMEGFGGREARLETRLEEKTNQGGGRIYRGEAGEEEGFEGSEQYVRGSQPGGHGILSGGPWSNMKIMALN